MRLCNRFQVIIFFSHRIKQFGRPFRVRFRQREKLRTAAAIQGCTVQFTLCCSGVPLLALTTSASLNVQNGCLQAIPEHCMRCSFHMKHCIIHLPVAVQNPNPGSRSSACSLHSEQQLARTHAAAAADTVAGAHMVTGICQQSQSPHMQSEGLLPFLMLLRPVCCMNTIAEIETAVPAS